MAGDRPHRHSCRYGIDRCGRLLAARRHATHHPRLAWRAGGGIQRGRGRPVRLLPRAGLPDLVPGQRLRPGLLEADRAPGERPQAAALLRHADRRHGPAGGRPQRHPVPVRLGDHGLSAFFLVTTEDHKTEAREAGWVYLVATHAATLCCSPVRPAARGHGLVRSCPAMAATPALAHGHLRPGAGRLRPESRHHAAARLAARAPTPSRPATSRRSCRASSSRWASTAWSG